MKTTFHVPDMVSSSCTLRLVRVLRRPHPRLAIIASSGLGAGLTADHKAQLQALSVTAFLAKPYSARDLLETLQKALSSPSQAGSE